ncbi:hypothetical protein TL16_g05204 [Triparma laevis f. inornata]|uniref:Glycosyltransferase 61 catalytic domain-containing protein n=1 Tax=Triparma laevis f. inornata TaxID=1714386 RepID=A0A9W7AJS0_9STRA|nr:hypothetical protein TL16_g05204 [Triparma laevis f. inornata]
MQSSPPDTVPKTKYEALQSENLRLTSQLTFTPSHPPPSQYKLGHGSDSFPLTSTTESCDSRFGTGLIESFKNSPIDICTGGTSKLTCYGHKHPFNSKKQFFCIAQNFEIDFNKVKGTHGAKKNSRGNEQYHSFERGAVKADCEKVGWRDVGFEHHTNLALSSFIDNSPNENSAEIEKGITYLLMRDEDMENAFHSTADFINMEIVHGVVGVERSKVVLFDRQPDGPYYELIEKVFSEGELRRSSDFQGKTVKFEKLIFHLESPAGIIFPKIGQNQKSLECYNSILWRKYAARVLKAFNLYDVKPPIVPSLTLILRERTNEKNIGRVLDNKSEVINTIKKCTLCDTKIVDLAGMSYYDQIKIIRSTNVLIGVHGAGLMNIIFAAEEAVLVEIHPHYRQDRHFRVASRMSGKVYMPMR